MPQMNPMNWLLLFLLFNLVVYITMVKLHFLYLSFPDSKSSVEKFSTTDSMKMLI